MHELSLVSSVADTVQEALAAYPGARVQQVRLRIGALAAVVEDSLQFCWGIVTERTPLEGAKLVIKPVPVAGRCPACAQDVEISSVQSFRCPLCGGPVADLKQGRELEVESIEIEDAETEKAPS